MAAAGFAEPQAEALTTVMRDLRDWDLSQVATKADLQNLQNIVERLEAGLESEVSRLESKISTDIARLRSELELRIAESKVEVIRWVFGIAVAQAALILAVLRLFPGAHS